MLIIYDEVRWTIKRSPLHEFFGLYQSEINDGTGIDTGKFANLGGLLTR